VPSRRARRVVVVLMVVLGVLVAGFAVADSVARHLAEQRLADEIRTSEDLPETPNVTVHGWPFLTQVIAGRYQRIDVRIRQLPVSSGLSLGELDAVLSGVRVPLSDVLQGNVQRIPVAGVRAEARVSYRALDGVVRQQLPAGLLQDVSLARGSGGRLRVAATYTGTGGPLPVRGQVDVSTSDDSMKLRVREGSLTSLPPFARARVAQMLGTSIELPDLPFGLRVLGVDADAGGVVLRVGGTGVVLTPG
jgi:hypothetical protein